MIVSQQDINQIIENSLTKLNKEDFTILNSNDYFQLKNIDHHCVFFDISYKTCIVYKHRPQGCRFYPLIYNYDKNKCVFDLDCPRTHLFYQNNRDLKKTCEKLKFFLSKQLQIDIL